MDYPGKVITKTQVTPTQTSASGNWTLDDQAAAIKNNNWPVALVPNPISKSLRFNSADTAYLNRTPATATNRRTWTWSGWFKRAKLTSDQIIFQAGDTYIRFGNGSADTLWLNLRGAATNYFFTTSQVFRDVSSWYHLTLAVDTTQATNTNRVKLYVNGNQVTNFSTSDYPPQNTDTAVNSAVAHNIGYYGGFGAAFDGYMTEINFVDGQALTPSDFGLTNPQTGQWIPKKYTGTYGTNGFYLNFKDATSTTTLGYDYSGNANNWTTNNFSVTAGSGNDSLTDVPTPWVAYNTTGDVGGVIRGNYCTVNPLSTTAGTYTQGNLRYVGASAWRRSNATISVSTGKWYWEVTLGNAPFSPRGTTTSYNAFGFGLSTVFNSTTNISAATDAVYLADSGYYKNFSGSWTDGGTGFSSGDTLAVAVDLDANTFTFYRNNTLITTGTIGGTAGRELVPIIISYDGSFGVMDCNFGQRPFAYTPPAGFRSLCTTNLPATAIGFGLTNQGNNYFAATTWVSAGGTETITNTINGVSCAPDFLWMKNRTISQNNYLVDANRGISKILVSNTTSAEATDATFVTALNSNGFSLGSGGFASSQSIVAWQWRANGAGSSNTAGTITSTVSANTTAGFSVVTYTGTGANATVGHGLGVAPSMIITKPRNSADNWISWHTALGATGYIYLNLTNASATGAAVWNSTLPTSTVFSIGTSSNINSSGQTQVAYCFAAVAGYSAFGSYTGNGSTDGPFVYTGFRPRFVMVKRTDGLNEWLMHDSARSTYNVVNARLSAQSSAAESTSPDALDFTSNGFKLRTTDGGWNASGGTYIYMAFAESPFQFANAR